MSNKTITISALNKYIKAVVNNDVNLKKLLVVGEVSNYRPHHSGHMYFTLKDEESRIDCVMFKSQASGINFEVKNGDKVVVLGYVDVYPASGKYQLYCQSLDLDGLGDLHKRFEMLKEKLEKEGLFKQEHKRELPKYPNKIGVITATTGAAIRDVVSTIERRYPIAKLCIFNTVVQGVYSKDSIIKSIDLAVRENVDVIIIGRGGGSIEDLWSFNEEEVVRKLYDVDIPIVSGVGHETDFTLTDFVADVRGQTPTSAATLATPDRFELIERFNNLDNHMRGKLRQIYRFQKTTYVHLIKSLDDNLFKVVNESKLQYENYHPEKLANALGVKTNAYQLEFKHMQMMVDKNIKRKLIENKNKFSQLVSSLDHLSPLKILGRGYSVNYSDEKIVKSVDDIKDNLKVILGDGEVNIEIAKKEVNKHE